MIQHYLSFRHQELLIKFIIQYIVSKHLITRSNVNTSLVQERKLIDESVDAITPGLDNLLQDSTRLKTDRDDFNTKTERIISNLDTTKKMFNDDQQEVLKCVQSLDQTDKELEETKNLYISKNISLLDDNYSIIFLFHKTLEDLNSPFSIHSPKFKTAPHGYLFILRVCSTIDSTNEYLSIYITLLCGDYDPILFYPFPYNIMLSLYDQSGEGKHITTIIKADENRSYFARPTGENNNEVGIMKFCPLSYLTDGKSVYLKDGVFFIRTFVDFMNTGSILVA